MGVNPLAFPNYVGNAEWEGKGTMLLRDNQGNANLIWISQYTNLYGTWLVSNLCRDSHSRGRAKNKTRRSLKASALDQSLWLGIEVVKYYDSSGGSLVVFLTLGALALHALDHIVGNLLGIYCFPACRGSIS